MGNRKEKAVSVKEKEKERKRREREEVKEAIRFYELFSNGLLKIGGSYAKVVNLRERKDRYIADVILGNDMEGWMERYYDCEYPKELINEILGKKKEKQDR